MSAATDGVRIIAVRTTTPDIPVPDGAVQVGCHKCGELCWIGPASQKMISEAILHGQVGDVICSDCCSPKEILGGIITKEMLAEYFKTIGMDR